MIYITGDTHIPTADIQKLGSKRFLKQKELSKNDFLIICGDFGGVWDESNEEKYWLKWLSSKKFSTLFIDGNHENFDLLKQCEEIEFCGGEAHQIKPGIIHLMRGNIFEICGKKVFAFGGAASHDRELRIDGKNWWKEELPSSEEYNKARIRLKDLENKVDVIVTHCAPSSIQRKLAPDYPINELTDFLEEIKNTVEYDKWYFGHYHIDYAIDEKHIAVFNNILSI